MLSNGNPMGFAPDASTLTIVSDEAVVIHGTIFPGNGTSGLPGQRAGNGSSIYIEAPIVYIAKSILRGGDGGGDGGDGGTACFRLDQPNANIYATVGANGGDGGHGGDGQGGNGGTGGDNGQGRAGRVNIGEGGQAGQSKGGARGVGGDKGKGDGPGDPGDPGNPHDGFPGYSGSGGTVGCTIS